MKLQLATLAFYTILFYTHQQTNKVVQLDISSLYNARPITILKSKTIVPWVKGIDIGGIGDGYATMAASVAIGDTAPCLARQSFNSCQQPAPRSNVALCK
ncbi:MAG: hypothetical protein H7289_11500 [Mucilaginibacter sp.]|nr:hypothetical protein [Mucilaginibacter sp.]